MNSFSAINRAIDYEISRQILLHKEGQADQIVQETRLWDESSQVVVPNSNLFFAGFFLPSTNYFLYLHHQKTFTMRKKEGLADYRYFPEPDLPEVVLTSDYINEISKSMPELPEAKRRRYENMGLSMQDVLFLANDDNVRFHLLCWCRFTCMCIHRLFRSFFIHGLIFNWLYNCKIPFHQPW